MAKSVRLSEEELCYLKCMRVLVNACAVELRRLFKDVWDKQNTQPLWQDDAQSGKMFFDNHKPNGIIKRYDDKIKNGQTSDWDMTVLCRVYVQYNFMDSVDTKYSDNVKTLRELRNVYSHLTTTSRSRNEFQNDLKQLNDVFSNLNLDQTVLTDALDIEVKDCDHQELRKEVDQLKNQLHSELQEVRQEMHDRFDHIENRLDEIRITLPGGEASKRTVNTLILAQVKRALSESKKLFVETGSYKAVANVVDTEQIVFLTGPSGVGKRMIALGLLREYEDNHGFEPLVVRNVDEMRQLIDTEAKQAILMRDIFGIFEFDQKKFDEWVGFFDTIEACADETKKFIFTSKRNIFERGIAWLSTTKTFKVQCVVDILQLDNLTSTEKRMMICRHLKEMDVDITENLIEMIVQLETPRIFPKCCEIFAKNQQLHKESSALEFFQRPVFYHQSIIEGMAQRDDKTAFVLLLLTMLCEQLRDSFLHDTGNNDEEAAQKFLSFLGYGDKRSKLTLKSAAENMLGIHLKRSGETFVILDQCLYDAVARVFHWKYPKQLIELCSIEFLCNKVHVVKDKTARSGDVPIILGENQFEFLSARFVSELKNGNVYSISSHIAFTSDIFVIHFGRYCEKRDYFRSLLQSKDKLHHYPFLYWSAWNHKEHLFKWIYSEYEHQDIGVSEGEMQKIAKACCISGNIGVLQHIVQTNFNVSAMVVNYDPTSLAMPPCGSSYRPSVSKELTEAVVQVGGLLHTACFHGNLAVVKLLVSRFNASVDASDNYGSFPINIAARQGHLDIVEYLMTHGVTLSRVKANKNTAMHDACETGQTEVASLLLEACPNLLHVEGGETHLRYPVHFATLSKQPKLVRLLLQKGANPDTPDSDKNTAFHTACMISGNQRTLKELNPSTNQINMVNRRNKTCLHLACEFGGVAMVDFLISAGANVNAVDYRRQTPLHVACEKNKMTIVEKLLAVEEADPFVIDIRGNSALHLTTNTDIQHLLIERMAQN